MKITGQKKLIKELKQVAPSVRQELEKTSKSSVKRYANFARKIAPVGATRETKNVINGQVISNEKGVFGFVNFARPTKESAIRQGSISYGRKEGDRGQTDGYEYIRTTRAFISDKYKRAMKSAARRGIKKATNG